MRRKSAIAAIVLLFLLPSALWASQIQAFKNAPARPATAAQAAAKDAEAHAAAESPEARTERALGEAKANSGTLYALLKEMPKGGDLHNHITGAVYAESLVQFAASSGLCVDRQSFALAAAPCQSGQAEARTALADPELYRNLIDAWSMRDLKFSATAGHDHFFDAFGKFGLATDGHLGEILAEVTARAARGNVQYLELMLAPNHGKAAELGAAAGSEIDLAVLRGKLLGPAINALVEDARRQLDQMEAAKNKQLNCARQPEAQAGACAVHVRYIYAVARANPPVEVFAQLLLGFELASHDPRVVGVNMVQPEDWFLPMRDFRLQTQMVGFLKGLYPAVHVSLHAGELRPGLVPPDGLRSHIRDSVEHGRAERIGHGVDVMYEDNPHELLAELARRNVMVEICLTSNDGILGVKGKQHPLAMYLKAGVPVALATDDEGVSRSEMTHEYERAVSDQGLDYVTLKRMARTSLEHSFLPGQSLWSDAHHFTAAHECAGERLGAVPSAACTKFLNGSEKAREQWRLEKRLAEFEAKN
jgi:hypothetical protein